MEEQLVANPTNEMNPTDDDHLMESASRSSGSDSGSDSEDEAQQSLQLQNLEAELSSNVSNYDAHVEYIKQLRKMGELDKLRKARESMSQLFPLTPSMWQEWAKDEASLSSGQGAVAMIEQLYERGVSDYLSVPLWCDYLSYVQEYDSSVRECSPAGLSKARNLFERALTAAGLHFCEGNQIWEAYKEFEQAIILTIDEADIESKTKQVQRVRSIFQRHLSVPLSNMSLNLRAYKTWEGEQGNLLNVDSDDLDGITSTVATAYRKALEMYDVRVSLEEQISKPGLSDSERLLQFMNYLKFEESSGDPARVTFLYERGISQFPISSDLWLDYTRYLDKTLKVGKVLKDAYYRATRNCPWVGELWVRYLLSLERVHAPEEEMSMVFERALQCTFSSYEEYLDLFLTRIDGLRRRISAAEEMQVLDYASIRGTFQRASDYLSPQLKGSDALWRLYSYWARLELFLVKDITAARGVWESLLKISGSMLEAWKGYIQMEIELGNINEARSLYRRCYTKKFPGSGSEDICHSWLRFEREFGVLDDYDHALQKITPRLEELRLYRLQQESKMVSSAEQKDNMMKNYTREKRKGPSLSEDSLAKRRKESKQVPKKETTLEFNDLGRSVDSDKKEEVVAKTEPDGKHDQQPRKKPYQDRQKYTDQCTAFISNLNVQTNAEHLHNFFSDVGGVVSIRILKDKFTGESRGLAYVDFSDEAHLTAAVAKNRQMLKGKKLSIAVSNPAQSKKKGGKPIREVAKDARKPTNATEGANGRDATESIQLKGKNTFAVPRVVRQPRLDVSKGKSTKVTGEEEENPKSNDEFRKMFVKS